MIVEQQVSETRVRHYSDLGMMLLQIETGNIYEDAEDNIPCIYTYEETNQPIPDHGDEPTPEDYESALSRLGVET